MDVPAKVTQEAPVRVSGSDGELGMGPIQGPRFRRLMTWIWLPSLVLLLVSPGPATILICFCSLFVIVRLSRLNGTPALVEAATAQWGGAFAIASLVLLLLQWTPGSELYPYAILGYLYATTIYFNARRLVSRDAPGRSASALARGRVTPAELRTLREEVARQQGELSSLTVFDPAQPELAKAWERRDPSRVAELLQLGDACTQSSWTRAISILNRAVRHTDRARGALNGMLEQAGQRLAAFNLDYGAIEAQRSRTARVEFTAAIPRNLSVRRIDAQNTAFLRGASTAAAKGLMGRVSPIAAVAVAAAALVAQQAYASRTLRQLKDVEGQLGINARAARGDFTLIGTVLRTRIVPQLDGVIALMGRLEAGLGEVPSNADPADAAQRGKAVRLALAVLEGRALAATMAGD